MAQALTASRIPVGVKGKNQKVATGPYSDKQTRSENLTTNLNNVKRKTRRPAPATTHRPIN